MENITQALRRAKAEVAMRAPFPQVSDNGKLYGGMTGSPRMDGVHGPIKRIEAQQLSWQQLYASHVVAFDPAVDETRYYDILRNQVMTFKPKSGAHVIAVSAPTLGCGATVTALNLAVSIARMPSVSVLVVDANTGDHSLANSLGLTDTESEGEEEKPSGCLSQIEIGDLRLHALRVMPKPGEIISGLVKTAARVTNASVVVIDAPPMLQSDTSVPLVSSADSVVLVLARGRSKIAELEICKTYLTSAQKVQVVLNKGGRHGL